MLVILDDATNAAATYVVELSRVSSPSGTPSGATVTDSAPLSSAPLETAADKGVAGGKADESRSSTATGIGGVRSIGAASANANSNADTGNLPHPAAGVGVATRGDGGGGGGGGTDGSGAGTLAMNSPASDQAKRFSSSSSSLQSALLPVENAPLQDPRPNSVPKDKRSSRGGTGAGGEGARKSSGSSHRKRREGHPGGGEGEGGSLEETLGERRSRKSRSGGGSGGDPSKSRRKDEREGPVEWVQT